jgi:hypothetical protein
MSLGKYLVGEEDAIILRKKKKKQRRFETSTT